MNDVVTIYRFSKMISNSLWQSIILFCGDALEMGNIMKEDKQFNTICQATLNCNSK